VNQAKNNPNQRVYSAGRPNVSKTKINRFVNSSGFIGTFSNQYRPITANNTGIAPGAQRSDVINYDSIDFSDAGYTTGIKY
jgi:hypothetical protein